MQTRRDLQLSGLQASQGRMSANTANLLLTQAKAQCESNMHMQFVAESQNGGSVTWEKGPNRVIQVGLCMAQLSVCWVPTCHTTLLLSTAAD